MNNLELQHKRTKIHRHYVPKYNGGLPKIVTVRRFAGALKVHDWNRNSFIYQLRCKRNQRVSIRSERRETFSELALAMIAYADYNPNNEYLFEVMCSVEKLAELCGQLYCYESGRKSYDPILHALHDWQEANLIIIQEGFDPEAKQYKAMRIWIRPEFFVGLGFSIAEIRDMLNKFKRWMEKNGLRDSYQRRYAKHILRLAKSNVASINDKHSLKNLLKKIKRLVVGEDEAMKREKEFVIKAMKHKQELIDTTRPAPDQNQVYSQKYEKWKQRQPLAWVINFENTIQNRFPGLSKEELLRCYVEHLPDS
ncbi:RepA family replication protein [Photorhabdus asymbiotica]|uniref:RepA family replication protein n=1 Tax=Photorhabdus asymbiotica TaxID=291112 RepID=UPI003DA76578